MVSPYIGEAPITVQFINLSENYPYFWNWDFNNDGIIDSTNQNPVFTYNSNKTYSVCLMVSNNFGNNNASFDIVTKTNYIHIPNFAPIADFSVDKTFVDVGDNIQFTDESKYAYFWRWDFDNNGTIDSIEQNPITNYNTLGYKTVRLTVGNIFSSN